MYLVVWENPEAFDDSLQERRFSDLERARAFANSLDPDYDVRLYPAD